MVSTLSFLSVSGDALTVVACRRPSVFVLVVACTLLLSALLASHPAEAAGSGAISGVVTDRDGLPVEGVAVQVTGYGGDRIDSSTDGEGRYVADGLPAGSYSVCFYPTDEQDLAGECWQDREMGSGHTWVQVTDDEVVTGIDAVLLPPSHLRGTVTDAQGAPVAGARVSTSWQAFGDDQPVSWWSAPVLTGADGSFDIGPLPSGWYRIRFSDTTLNRYATQWWEDADTAAAAEPVRLDRGESADGLDAVLADLAVVSGKVRGVDGVSVSGTRVRMFSVNSAHTVTEVGSGVALTEGGRFEIAAQPGTYRLAFDAAPGMLRSEFWRDAASVDTAQDVVVTGTAPVTDINAVLRLAPPVEVTRRPTLSGRARVGERLTAGHGGWDVSALRFTYQWRADGSIIPGVTGRRLLLSPQLRGKHIKVRVTATATARERSPGTAFTRRTGPVARAAH